MKSLFLAAPTGSRLAITPAGLARLGNLTHLRKLELGGLPVESIHPTSPAWLRELTSLESLSIDVSQSLSGQPSIDGSCLSSLSHLTNLKRLSLRQVRASDADLANLSGLTRLEYVHLDLSRVTDSGLRTWPVSKT